MTDDTNEQSPDAGSGPATSGPATSVPVIQSVRLAGTEERPVIEVTVAAPVAVVWPHLRDPELIRRWHGWEADSLDAEIDFIYREHADADDDTHVIRTKGGEAPGSFAGGDLFEAVAVDSGATIVRITRGPRGSGGDWDAMYDDITQGWISFLAQLKFAVERHPGVDRRTVFRGRFGVPGRPVIELLGASGLSAAVGERYQLSVDDGPRIAGTTWFRTEGQLGLTVDDYGPGLVVLADKPGPEDGTAEVSMVIVSTFGLTADEHARVESTWAGWWSTQHPEPQPGAEAGPAGEQPTH